MSVIIIGGGGHTTRSLVPVPPGSASVSLIFAFHDLNTGDATRHTTSYSSDNSALATVNSAGLVTIHGAGRVTITCTATRDTFSHSEYVELAIPGDTQDFYTSVSVAT